MIAIRAESDTRISRRTRPVGRTDSQIGAAAICDWGDGAPSVRRCLPVGRARLIDDEVATSIAPLALRSTSTPMVERRSLDPWPSLSHT